MVNVMLFMINENNKGKSDLFVGESRSFGCALMIIKITKNVIAYKCTCYPPRLTIHIYIF